MDIREFLSRLHVSRGPDANGEYTCRCPAHNDKTASMTVKAKPNGDILLCCHAGCRNEDILRAMGLGMNDLFREPKKKVQEHRKPNDEEKKGGGTKTTAAKSSGLGELTKVYQYRDEDGNVLFEVCRFQKTENGESTKTFRQRHYAPTNPAAKNGYVWNLSGVRIVPYNLPEVMAAIANGETIYLVEGEKDADTMTAMGFVATTNHGGASKTGTPKWTTDHTMMLRGADVVILPDNDDAGINDRMQVAAELLTVAKSVKLLDLRRIWADMPIKADITDLIEHMGTAAGIRELLKLERDTPAMDASEAMQQRARLEAAARIGELPGFCVDDGCICQISGSETKKLCTFSAIVKSVVTRDNGLNQEIMLDIAGWSANGRALPEVRVPSKNFRRMEWVTENWDIQANILPGATAMDKLRYAISEASAASAKRITEYTHTGWRRIGGKWAYLYGGGAMGADSVSVDLGSALSDYTMNTGYVAEDGDDLLATSILDVSDRNIMVPMVSMAFLAPLRDALVRAGYPPAFSMYVVGSSGTRKSTITALILSYFGRFTSMNLPASFNDTANYIRKKAFDLKDMLLVIDDYHPEGSAQARKRMEDTAQNLSRAFGDLAQRGRMNSDRTLADSMPPRSLAMISGEDMPFIQPSGLARYYIIQLHRGSIMANEHLTELQQLARRGGLANLMARYILWLQPQMDTLPDVLGKRFEELRTTVMKMNKGHERAPATVAHLLIGYEYYIKFLISEHIIETDDPNSYFHQEMAAAILSIISNTEQQAKEAIDESPTEQFCHVIAELLASKEKTVCDLTAKLEDQRIDRGNIGYADANYYYLNPELAYVAVCEVYTKKTQAFPLSQRMLYKTMCEEGKLAPDSKNNAARGKTIGGKTRRFLFIPREYIDGKSTYTQIGMTGISDEDEKKFPFGEGSK